MYKCTRDVNPTFDSGVPPLIFVKKSKSRAGIEVSIASFPGRFFSQKKIARGARCCVKTQNKHGCFSVRCATYFSRSLKKQTCF